MIVFENCGSTGFTMTLEKTVTGFIIKIDDKQYTDLELPKIFTEFPEADAEEILLLSKVACNRLGLAPLEALGRFEPMTELGTPIHRARIQTPFAVSNLRVDVDPKTTDLLVKTEDLTDVNKMFRIPIPAIIRLVLPYGITDKE